MKFKQYNTGFFSVLLLAVSVAGANVPIAGAERKGVLGPLRVCPENPRYFADPCGRPVVLAGAHDGWELQDYAWGDRNEGILFKWESFLDFLSEHHHNVIRLWVVEHTKIVNDDKNLTEPMAYLRVSGLGAARDGGDKFDLDRFNPDYFQRLRRRIDQARRRGLYVIVMLFQGWSIDSKGGKVNPWPYHPFQADNNINGINGDIDEDGQGSEVHTWLGGDHPITQRQRAYVRRVIDTVGDLDNVLYEIANESHSESVEWQYRMIQFIKRYENDKGRHHPIGMTSMFGGRRKRGLNRDLFRSPADWISPKWEAPPGYNYKTNPPPNDGKKIVLLDTDHLYGVDCKDLGWVWKTFTRGHHLLYMDQWTLQPDDVQRRQVRAALGQALQYAGRLNLKRVLPHPELSSSKFCLADPGREYIVYNPAKDKNYFSLELPAGTYQGECLNVRLGKVAIAKPMKSRGGSRKIHYPFKEPIVFYLKRIDE